MNEEQITRELKKNNIEIFPRIVELYKNRIFSMAYKFTNDYNEAQDLSQEIFLKIYKQIENFRFESKLSTWIYRVSINTCLDWKKKNKKVRIINFTSMSRENNDDPLANICDRDLPPDEKVIELEEQEEIHRLIYELPDIYKTVIVMYHFENMSYSDIASILEVPEKTVETRLYRARRKIRDELKKLKDGGVNKWIAKRY